jgi:hypothetical protein
LVNNGSGDITHKNVGLSHIGVNALPNNGPSDNVGIVGTFSDVNVKNENEEYGEADMLCLPLNGFPH